MRSFAGLLLPLCVSMLLVASDGRAQDMRDAQPGSTDGEETEGAPAPLAAGEVARVGEQVITDAEYLQYLGTLYARQPEGEQSLQQVLVERILHDAAAAAEVSVEEADVQDLAKRLDARARKETGGAAGLQESLKAEDSELRDSLELLALQEKIIAAETGDEHPSDEVLRDWMDVRLAAIEVLPSPLDDPIAVRWTGGAGEPGGEVSRVDLGRRVYRLLEPEERAGVLTELIGVLLIRDAAKAAEVELTPELVAEEIARRDAMVRGRDATSGISYADIVQQMQKLSLEELIASPGFGAEVLLRVMVEKRWTEAQLRLLFEAEREAFVERLGPDITFEGSLPTVWSVVRQRSYRQLFAKGRIVRRF